MANVCSVDLLGSSELEGGVFVLVVSGSEFSCARLLAAQVSDYFYSQR